MVAARGDRQGEYISLRPLVLEDAVNLNRLLTTDPREYSRHFHPFPFTVESIRERITAAKLDQYFAIELRGKDAAWVELAGFYMLRGLDDGFKDLMYGVYVSAAFSGLGIGRLTLQHAECYCKLNGVAEMLLKVHPDNQRARQLYESQGFRYVRDDAHNNHAVLAKRIFI